MNSPGAGSQTLLRSLNAKAILEALARRGPLTRAELMGETGLSRTAVTQVLRMLEAGEAVASAGVDRATHGPAATRVSLNPRLGFAAAVHVDHRSVHVVVVDVVGTVCAERHSDFVHADDRVPLIAALVAECAEEVSGPVRVALVGVPGIVAENGAVRDDRGPDGGSFRTLLSSALGCPVRIENDVNLAALAESRSGVGAELSSFALLLLDDGVGAGIVIDGKLHRGASGLAGEVQFLPQPPLPIAAPVLGDVVVADLALAHGRDPQEPFEVHLEACADGDEAAAAMIDEMARRLVYVAGTVALILDPVAFVLAGYALHPAFISALRAHAERVASLLPLRFLRSAFGREATLVGAREEVASALRDTLFARILSPAGRSSR